MGIKLYYTTVTASRTVKSQQAEVMRILESKSIQYELIDISVGREVCDEMRSKAGNPAAVPPQLFNEDQYCGVREAHVYVHVHVHVHVLPDWSSRKSRQCCIGISGEYRTAKYMFTRAQKPCLCCCPQVYISTVKSPFYYIFCSQFSYDQVLRVLIVKKKTAVSAGLTLNIGQSFPPESYIRELFWFQ
uniref:SH3 domain-binding glutamic acid-rich-like protein 3 n=1 Tax=Cyclopterus lumpus TaxID=8103 RepID=A0A8C2WYH2_CYCLU